MIDIMSNMQHYVPVLSRQREVALESGEYVTLNEQCIHSILFGGDQLTAARAPGSQLIRSNSELHQFVEHTFQYHSVNQHG